MTGEKDNNSIFKVAVNLFVACLISGCIIAVVFYITDPIAQAKTAEMKQQSMQSLVQGADQFKPVPDKTDWFAAEKGGKVIGYVVPSSIKGYGGQIRMLVGVTADGKVIDFTILEANETPGLGDNASKPAFRDQLKDKSADKLVVVKDPSKKENVQAMTGATISSRAVTLGVRNAVEAVTQFTGGK